MDSRDPVELQDYTCSKCELIALLKEEVRTVFPHLASLEKMSSWRGQEGSSARKSGERLSGKMMRMAMGKIKLHGRQDVKGILIYRN